ncbi:VOC family protein [Limimaricola cinnabarinus]|jgi:catechol 2,3-dioxygenase-like lactoylglutathione lyase family enzyme|uniref:Extradiol dioxygenase n=1 Tax=Limimaricola cinnabarinus TaxID=1125964 RepID=A0A2G1MJC1_9RHOB|nr:VOC family protein [Limimaricola cinnabarinus]PHP28843.1 extradiol dioxygenase [Limimaricola cinnabarinus]
MTRLGAVSLVVPDYDEAIAFFTGPMGFDLAEDVAMEGKRWVRVVPPSGGTGLVLARADGPAQYAAIGAQGGGRVWLFLETDDFARDAARMKAGGVVFEEAPRHEPYGVVAVFRDPWGNRWDLIEPAG